MRSILDGLHESDHAIATALGGLRTDPERIEAALSAAVNLPAKTAKRPCIRIDEQLQHLTDCPLPANDLAHR